jgi:hypothetical protein
MNPIHERFDCQRRFAILLGKVRRVRDDAAALSDYAAQDPLWLIVVALTLPCALILALAAILP